MSDEHRSFGELMLEQGYADAGVRLSDLAPVCYGADHIFAADSYRCACGRLTRSVDGAYVYDNGPAEPAELPPAGGLTDEDVRRLEHPEEFTG